MKDAIPYFECKKCGHTLFLESEDLKKLSELDCPYCGEAGGIWIFVGFCTKKFMDKRLGDI